MDNDLSVGVCGQRCKSSAELGLCAGVEGGAELVRGQLVLRVA